MDNELTLNELAEKYGFDMDWKGSDYVLDVSFDLSRVIGKPYKEVAAMQLEWFGAWPCVDRETLLVDAIWDASEVNDDLVLADLIDGAVVMHRGASQFLVSRHEPQPEEVVDEVDYDGSQCASDD